MPGFRVFMSNRLELLLEDLSKIIEEPLTSPLEQEVIVVQSKGMERWICLQLAQKYGIWANCAYPFPNKILHQLMAAVIPAVSDTRLFEPEVMSFRIMKELIPCSSRPGFESLRHYLGNDEDYLKHLQLAESLAKVFDHYLVYRPEWLLDWEAGHQDHWQAQLWRELTKGTDGHHQAWLKQKFLKMIDQGQINQEILPHRLSIFGIPALPPLHLEVFMAISRYLEVNLLLLNPCQDYWYDLVSEKGAAKMQKRLSQKSQSHKILTAEELHLETGHPLLASLGKHGASFLQQLLAFSSDLEQPLPFEEFHHFADPGEETLLSCLQADILFLRDRRGQSGHQPKEICPQDKSVQIHSCHSPLREVEALYDYLLDLFDHKPDLEPRDILVMTPDIESYAPYISAVFEGCQDPRLKIPYRLADRSVRTEGRLIEVFLKILSLREGRFTQTQILDLLESPPIQKQLKINEEDLATIRGWIEGTQIRWGLDGEDRVKRGLPKFSENTWAVGLDRLLLGYALTAKENHLFGEILPYDDIEGTQSRLLGPWLEFLHQLFQQVNRLEQPRTLAQWSDELLRLIQQFFSCEENDEAEFQILQKTLFDLREYQSLTGFDQEIDLKTIRSYLSAHLTEKGFHSGFLSGGVTFCTLLPMRSIPFRIIALIGMGDNQFPRRDHPVSFNLMAQHPRWGDPSKREEDRYLFLEAVLCAREQLYLSYVGQSQKDNSPLPPSGVVSELLDLIEQSFIQPGQKILDQIVTYHRLQAFSSSYFKPEGPLFSYAVENYQALKSRLLAPSNIRRAFLSQPLPEPTEQTKAWKTVRIEQLIQFLTHPAKFFLSQRLGLSFEKFATTNEEREPFEVQGLDKYHLEQEMLQKRLQGLSFADYYPLVKARGILPPGLMGKITYQQLSQGLDDFAKKIQPYSLEGELAPLRLDLELDGFRLLGEIDSLYPAGLLHYRYAQLKGKDLLRIWLEHLVINALAEPGYPCSSFLLSLDKHYSFQPVVMESRNILKNILAFYAQGWRCPLPFYPETSWAFTKKWLSFQDVIKALEAARGVWEGNAFGRLGEAQDPYFNLCFGQMEDPLDEEFQKLALEIYQPLTRCMISD